MQGAAQRPAAARTGATGAPGAHSGPAIHLDFDASSPPLFPSFSRHLSIALSLFCSCLLTPPSIGHSVAFRGVLCFLSLPSNYPNHFTGGSLDSLPASSKDRILYRCASAIAVSMTLTSWTHKTSFLWPLALAAIGEGAGLLFCALHADNETNHASFIMAAALLMYGTCPFVEPTESDSNTSTAAPLHWSPLPTSAS